MNRQIQRVMAIICALYVVLFVRLNVVQVFQASTLNAHPGNTRQLMRDFQQPRGDIVTADGQVVAHSNATPDGRYAFQRTYPAGDLYAHIAGYFGFVVGSTGVERAYGDELSGQSDELQLRALTHVFDSERNVGDVILTVDSKLQQAAKDDLGDRRGSVVVLDPRNGAVKALWSYPSFDPNLVSTNEGNEGPKNATRLEAADGKPLLARTFRETFAPGSTFKVVTAAAGLASGKVTPDSPSYPPTDAYTPPATNRAIHNAGGEGDACGGAVGELLAVSCNTGFARMGTATLGPGVMVQGAEAFGWNATPPIDLPGAAASRFPTDFGRRLGRIPGGGTAYEDSPRLAFASIGQGDTTATPLQMALVAAAAGTNGMVPTPHVVASIRDNSGDTVRRIEPKPWRRAVTPAVAARLRALMVGVVEDGTARSMAIDGWEVGAKTGTAQTRAGEDRSHAWMVAWLARPGEPAVAAVAVIVEAQDGVEEQTGARVAGPVALDMLERIAGGAG